MIKYYIVDINLLYVFASFPKDIRNLQPHNDPLQGIKLNLKRFQRKKQYFKLKSLQISIYQLKS